MKKVAEGGLKEGAEGGLTKGAGDGLKEGAEDDLKEGAGDRVPKVLFVASEALPFIKTGGLADVAYALPKDLKKIGVEVAVMLPKHSAVKAEYQDELELIAETEIGLGWRKKYMGIQTMVSEGIRYYFIDNEDYFGGSVYKGGDAESEQYLYFCRAVLAALPFIDFKPDILHCNDWHTGMIPMLLRTQLGLTELGHIKTIFTIHNIKFQGAMGFKLMQDVLSIPRRYYTPEYIEANGAANMMKAALVFANRITTVSPTYAREIMYPFFGMGMEGILRARQAELSGILNGIDPEDFDPESDPALAAHFDAERLAGKRECKKALRAEFDMDIKLTVPIFCMVTRLTSQKGLDLVREALEELLAGDVGFILVGSGEKEYEDFFNYIATKYPGKSGIWIGYHEDLAHRVYAGADFLLMPSEFEPCGLSQMIAQRYGTLPIVRETGGLVDTVSPYNQYTKSGDGFSVAPFNAHDMLHTIKLALSVYRDKPALRKLRRNAMKRDNSFLTSAGEYRRLYEEL
ncbi:MAG: glycogen synthase GlgA [Clostridiales Family XIII bacterium]|nr:glycogen synthase GlgA [Clostridiales Family XIII bacterium]